MILTITPNPTVDRVYFIDNLEYGKVYRADKFKCSAGGKGINVAKVSKILESRVSAMGFVGGNTGDYIKNEISRLGICCEFTDVSGDTRTNVNISDSRGQSAEILEPGPSITDGEQINFFDSFTKACNNFNVICASGSLPRGLNSSFYSDIIKISSENNKRVIVDTSGETLKDILSFKPYMVKPNIDELSYLLGGEITTNQDIKDGLLFLYEKGVKVPFITLGAEGGAAYIDNKFYKFIAPEVKVINAVGSGDSTIAGIAVGIDRGMNIINSLSLEWLPGQQILNLKRPAL